ncbi:MAG: DNA internalization-related competence protein ComEC/Rec2 [Deltaproteobacteria bacterium]|nr:DNA internalization-related competence protein ComEC/Rec2 [Deltaproteobacteria bacterium]
MNTWIKQLPNQGIWLVLTGYSSGLIFSAAIPAAHHLLNHTFALSVALIFSLYIISKRHSLPLWPIITALSFTLGFCAYATSISPPAATTDLSGFANNQCVTITATVVRIEPQQGRWRMDVSMENITSQQRTTQAVGTLRVQVGRKQTGKTEPSPRTSTILPGDHITFRAKLRKPRRYGLPGEFNYPEHLARSHIYMTAFVDQENSMVRLPQQTEPSLRCRIERWRIALGDQISAYYSPQHAAYLLSLTLGQKSRFSPEQREQLANYGISHLFSISGLHLGLIASLIYLLLNRLYRSSEQLMLWLPAQMAVPLLTLPPLLFYLSLSGSALPTVRAALLTCITVAALISYRATPPLTLLALVATAILAYDPLALFSASFQLSFAGVGALIYCLANKKRAVNSVVDKWLIVPLTATIIATIATTPIALCHFHTFAPAGVLCNIIAIPLIGVLTVPVALLATLTLPALPQFSLTLFDICLWLIDTTLNISSSLAQGPLAGTFAYLSPTQHGALILCALAALTFFVHQTRRTLLLLSASTVMFIAPYFYAIPAPLEFTPFSVGQGESLLLRLGKKKSYLIDGGGFYKQSFDVGKQLLAPALGTLGVKHFDAVILSHDHPDHRKGLIHILRHFNVDQFWSSIPVKQLHWSLQKVLKEKRIPTRLFAANWTNIALEGETLLDIFVPPDDTAKMNDRSLVVLARYKNDGILLTGDLEQHGVTQLLNGPLLSPITALKLPHHGSRRSRPRTLVNETQAKITIASVGFNNSYHFPHPETIAAVDENQAILIRTDRDGTVRLESFGDGWQQQPLAQP